MSRQAMRPNLVRPDYDIAPLVAAVILQAAREAHEGSQDARQWLVTDAPLWLDGIGVDMDPAQIMRWIKRGCKIPRRGRMMLGV